MKKIFFIAALFCGTAVYAQQSAITPAAAGVTYGKAITADKAITLISLNQALATDTVYRGKVTGEVIEVCKKKGCFMKLKQADGNHVMVRFTDYAFFMPQNIVGKKVVVDGTAKATETSVEHLRHYAADAGKSNKEIAKITQPKKNIQFMADGVLVME